MAPEAVWDKIVDGNGDLLEEAALGSSREIDFTHN